MHEKNEKLETLIKILCKKHKIKYLVVTSGLYGALFYDLHNNDGIADTLKVITNDGGTGDNDDVINSFIDENSTSGYSILDTKFEGGRHERRVNKIACI